MYIDVEGVHANIQSRCGLSTLLSESLGKSRELFLMIPSLKIQDALTD